MGIRRLLQGILVVFVLAGCGAPDSSDVPAAVSEKGAYRRVQLHLHGSLSEYGGTMRGHNAAAALLNAVDVLWWTDHDWRIAGHAHVPGFDFDQSVATVDIPYRKRPGGRPPRHTTDVWWETETAPDIVRHKVRLDEERVAQGARSLLVEAQAGQGGAWQWHGIRMESRQQRLIAPLASEVQVSLMVWLDRPAGEDSEAVVWFELSEQDRGLANLYYVVGGTGAPRVEQRDGKLFGIVPVSARPGEWTRIEMFPADDAERLGLGGRDNSLHRIRIGARVRRGATRSMQVDELRIVRRRTGEEILAWAEDMARSLSGEFGIQNHVGVEVSYGVHLNAFLPAAGLPDFDRFPHGLEPAEAVAWIHTRGGLASYNHVFGTNDRARSGYMMRRRYVLENDAFGADMLEVGYPHRVLPLQEHLDVWDELGRKRVIIAGIGTSDSHSQNEGWRSGNNYVSWVWAEGASKQDLLAGLRSRRIFFGDPVLFRGEMFLRTVSGGRPMGSVINAQGPFEDVELRITGLPDHTEIRWVEQGEVVRTFTPPGGDWSRVFRVDTREYRFVRAEVWKSGRGIAFTNCLYFVPEG